MHRKTALGLTLLQILDKAIKPINAGIHVWNVGTQHSGITVQLYKNIQNTVKKWMDMNSCEYFINFGDADLYVVTE